MCIAKRTESINPFIDIEPTTYGEFVFLWTEKTFENHSEILGYPERNVGPAYLGSNDLIRRVFLLLAALQAKEIDVLTLPNFKKVIESLIKAYDEPRTSCCSYWFSIKKEEFVKNFQPLLNQLEIINYLKEID